MNSTTLMMVRIYISEAESKKIIDYLHNEAKVKGVSAFRAIAGYGKSGKMHSTSLVDLSLALPLIIEFFDEPVKIAQAIERLKTMIEPDHIVSWPVSTMV